MMAFQTAISNPVEEERILERLEIKREHLTYPCQQGLLGRLSCLPLEPPASAGQYCWSRTTAGLREVLVPEGWAFDRGLAFPAVVSPDGRYAIAVMLGDRFTGRAGGVPTTKYRRGERGQAAVNLNQYLLFVEPGPEEWPRGMETWVLLRHFDGDAIWAELSLPTAVSKSGRISQWQQRLLLGNVAASRSVESKPAGLQPNIEIELPRKKP